MWWKVRRCGVNGDEVADEPVPVCPKIGQNKPVPKCPKRGRRRAGKVAERGDRGRGEGGETYFVVFGFQRG